MTELCRPARAFRGIAIWVLVFTAVAIPAGAAGASAEQGRRPLTIHQAWLASKAGARQVGERANASSEKVQPESACVRWSRYEIHCPFSFVLGDEGGEFFERCHDIARITEVGKRRLHFSSLEHPRCEPVVNKTP